MKSEKASPIVLLVFGYNTKVRERERERERESIFFLYFESKDIKLIEKKTDVSLNIKVD